jgi:hypothetical protein
LKSANRRRKQQEKLDKMLQDENYEIYNEKEQVVER